MKQHRGNLQKKKGFFRNRRGQSTMEYILILFIVVMIAVKFRNTIVGKINNLTTQLGTQLDDVANPGTTSP